MYKKERKEEEKIYIEFSSLKKNNKLYLGGIAFDSNFLYSLDPVSSLTKQARKNTSFKMVG